MGILEYWVIDVRGRQIWAFQLTDGWYENCQVSQVLTGLPINLLSETLQQVDSLRDSSASQGNGTAVRWFAQKLGQIKN